MGLRFRRSIRLGPGVRLNLSRRAIGISTGMPGLRYSVNTSGRRSLSMGIPGTGLSYVTVLSARGPEGRNRGRPRSDRQASQPHARSPASSPPGTRKNSRGPSTRTSRETSPRPVSDSSPRPRETHRTASSPTISCPGSSRSSREVLQRPSPISRRSSLRERLFRTSSSRSISP